MIYQKKGTVFRAEGKTFCIGGIVFANAESEYMGLYGTVTEIRTGDDRETENDTPDIYCEFILSDSTAMTAELESRFSDLYGQDKKVEDISLDWVIMSPEMLEPVTAREPKCNGNLLTLTCLEAQIDHVEGTTLAISNEMGVLLCKMREDLDNYDFPPALTRVEKMINGYMFTYGDRESQEEGPCVVYVISETPVLRGNYEEETK